MANLFSKAKASQPKKETHTKEQKIRVNIDSHSQEGDVYTIYEKMAEIARLDADIKNKQTKSDILSAEIKTIGKDEWIKLMDKSKENPGSFMLESTDNLDISQVMFIPQDKYIKINEERAIELREKYNEGIVTEKTTYKFNTSLLEKYSDILSELIQNCDKISDNDKDVIIEAETEFSITKGTIDKVKDFENVEELVNDINPVIGLKGFEVING